MATITSAPTTKKSAKPHRPDEEAFRKAEAAAKKDHEDVQEQLNQIRAKIESAKPERFKNPRQQELKNELTEIRQQNAAKKALRGKLEDQIKALQDNINTRVKELNAKKGSMSYRTLPDLEAAIRGLDAKVSTGQMKIVDEKKALQEMSNLNRQKKNFPALQEQQAAIDADRAKLKGMKEQKQDPEVKTLTDKYDELDAEFKALKVEQETLYQNFTHLNEERTRLYALQQEKWTAIKTIQDEYYQSRNAFRAYEREARKIRAQEQAEYALQKKHAIAVERMEAASQPAFAAEIITCEGLVAFFDPSSAEAAKKAKLAAAPRDLAAKPVTGAREYESKKPMKVLKKEEEDFFVGGGGKKKRSRKPREESTESSKIDLNVGLLQELSKVDVPVPSSKEEVPSVLKKLREKLQYFQDNQERVTKENIAKAQKDVEKLDKVGESPVTTTEESAPASGAATPAIEGTNGEQEKEEPVAEEEAQGGALHGNDDVVERGLL